MNDPWAGFLISSVAWQQVPHAKAISDVRAAGFGGVEILCKPGHFECDNRAHVEDVQAALEQWPDAIVTFHAPFYDVDMASSDPNMWDHAMQDALQALRVASMLRAGNMTLHVRSNPEMRNWGADNLAALHRSLDRLMPAAAQRNMTLAVENYPPGCFTADAEDIRRLLDAYPADLVGACIDAGHAHLGGNLIELAGLLAPRAFVAHIHDNHARGKDEHLVPGQGTIPWKQVVETLRTHGFGGWLVMEVVAVDRLGETLNSLKQAIVQTGISELTLRSI